MNPHMVKEALGLKARAQQAATHIRGAKDKVVDVSSRVGTRARQGAIDLKDKAQDVSSRVGTRARQEAIKLKDKAQDASIHVGTRIHQEANNLKGAVSRSKPGQYGDFLNQNLHTDVKNLPGNFEARFPADVQKARDLQTKVKSKIKDLNTETPIFPPTPTPTPKPKKPLVAQKWDALPNNSKLAIGGLAATGAIGASILANRKKKEEEKDATE